MIKRQEEAYISNNGPFALLFSLYEFSFVGDFFFFFRPETTNGMSLYKAFDSFFLSSFFLKALAFESGVLFAVLSDD